MQCTCRCCSLRREPLECQIVDRKNRRRHGPSPYHGNGISPVKGSGLLHLPKRLQNARFASTAEFVVHVVPKGIQRKENAPAGDPRGERTRHAFAQRQLGSAFFPRQQIAFGSLVRADVDHASNRFGKGMGDKGCPVGSKWAKVFGSILFHGKDFFEGFSKRVPGDLLVDLDHEQRRCQYCRGHASTKSRNRNVSHGILRQIVSAGLGVGILRVVQEPPGSIVGCEIDALYHSNRCEWARDARIEGSGGAGHRPGGFYEIPSGQCVC